MQFVDTGPPTVTSCNSNPGDNPAHQSTSCVPTHVVNPTNPPAIPTRAPTLPPIPTDTKPPQSGDLIYSTTFSDLSDWNKFTKTDLSNYTIDTRDYGLFITIPAANDYADFYYNLGSADVRMEADVELVGGTNYTYFILQPAVHLQKENTFSLWIWEATGR